MINEKIRYAEGIILIVILFIFASYIVQNNIDFFKSYIRNNFFSMILYVSILIVSAVIAPVDMIFLMPVATAVWGWFIVALLSLLGWTIGSAVVFVLSRRYGVPLIRKFIPLKKIHKYEKFMPKENVFAEIILLRIIIPIDIISYTIGLLTDIRFIPYFFATLIGFLPLAFYLAYLGTLPAYIQVIGFIMALLIFLLGFLSVKYRQSRK